MFTTANTDTEEYYPEGNYMMFPHELAELNAKTSKTYEERLKWCIYRLTLGYHRLSATITYAKFQEMTDINGYRNIASALKRLEDSGTIIIESYGQGKKVVYRVNTNPFNMAIDADTPPASFNQPLSIEIKASPKPLLTEIKHINKKSLKKINTHNTSSKPVCDKRKNQTETDLPTLKVEDSISLPIENTELPTHTLQVSTPKASVPLPTSKAVMEPVSAATPKIESDLLPIGRSKAVLSLDTLRWLYNQYGQDKVLEVLAIIEFQGTNPQNYIGLVVHMCKNGYAIPNGYIPMAEKKVLEEKRRQEQEKRQCEEAAEATSEVELDKIFKDLSEEERNRLLDEAKDSVKGMSPYHQRPFYLQYLVKEMLRNRLSQLKGVEIDGSPCSNTQCCFSVKAAANVSAAITFHCLKGDAEDVVGILHHKK